MFKHRQHWQNWHSLIPPTNLRLPCWRAVAESLAKVLRNEVDPLTLLFPSGSFDALERIYGGSPVAQVYQQLLREMVREVLETPSSKAPWHILEIGAGTGATTAAVIDLFSDQQMRYTFTDLSPLFLERARTTFAAYPHLRYELLNIEKNPAEQGFSTGGYNLIIAANVLHATSDLRATLEHVKQLLAPGGILVLLEGTRPQAWIDMTFGLTEGWWRFTDHDVRPNYPLLGERSWQELLSEVGFIDCVPLSFQDASGQMVLAAQKAALKADKAENAVEWLIFARDLESGARLVNHKDKTALVALGETIPQNDSAHGWNLQQVDQQSISALLAEPSLNAVKGIVYLAGGADQDTLSVAEGAEWDAAALLAWHRQLATSSIARIHPCGS